MKNYKYKEYVLNILPCVFYGLICGATTGTFICLFKWLASKAEYASRYLYGVAKFSPWYIALVFIAIAVLGVAMAILHKKLPEVKGGGIPRSEGVLRGVLTFKCIRTLIGTFIGSMVGFFVGLPLGCEGPAVLMGTCIGGICVNFSKNKSAWTRYVTSGGAGAGFAVATGAPLSGVLFVLEEVHKRFTPMLVLTVSVSVITATCANMMLSPVLGVSTSFLELDVLAGFELKHVGYLLLLGLVVAVAVATFDASISLVSKVSKKLKKYVKTWMKLILVFILTGVLSFTITDGVYSGHHVIAELVAGNKILSAVIVLLFVRFIMMLLVTDSGATGGIFIPTLAIGALIGTLAAELLIVMGLDKDLYQTVILLSMCAFIGGTLRAPLTATVLFIELTGQFTNLFYVALVVFTVYVITELLNRTPFYDRVLHNMEEHENEGKVYYENLFEMKVSSGSFVIGKTVRDIMWPTSSVVLSIRRVDEVKNDIGNVGEKVLFAGDTVVLKANYSDEKAILNVLYGLVGKESQIKIIKR